MAMNRRPDAPPPDAARTPLSRVDRAFLNMERPTNPMLIVGLIVLGTRLDRRRLRDLIARRFASSSRFRTVPRDGLYQAVWEPDERFNIDDHVLSAALPAPGRQSELEALVGELASEPLPAGRPLWSFHIVERFGRGSAIIVRIHHCYADGIALVRVLFALADRRPASRQRAGSGAIASVDGNDSPSSIAAAARWFASTLREGGRLAAAGVDLARHPEAAAAAVTQASSLVAELARFSLLSDDPPSRLKRPLCGSRRVAWGPSLSLEEVKTIGRVLGCTVNDVLVATLAGALGQYLEAHGDEVSGLTLRAAVPVDLRAGEPAGEPLGNRFGLVLVELPVGIRHPLERLYGVRAAMQSLKRSEQSMLTYGLLAAIGSLPRGVEDWVIDLFSAKASLVASNLHGPEDRLFIGASPIRQMLFWVPQSGSIGTGVSMLSYNGRVHFGVIADREVVPHPAELIAGIKAAFEQLVLLVLLGGSALAT
jgi:WS/DGAT/MGAT family acyltransferase